MDDTVLTQSYWQADMSQDLLNCTLPQLLRQVALEFPEQVGFVDGEGLHQSRRRWTYGDFLAEVEGAARGLMEVFSPGERLGIYAPNSVDWLIIQHALTMAGLVVVPINPAYAEGELEAIAKTSGIVGLFYVSSYRGRDLAAIADVAARNLPDLRWTSSIENWRKAIGNGDLNRPFPPISPDDTLLIQFTSGTTGAPKGACLHHRGVINMARFVGQRVAFPHRGVWINSMPLYHVGGSVVAALATLNGRGTFVVAAGFDPGQMLELIESEGGNCSLVVPTMVQAMFEHPEFADRDMSSMVTVLTGAAPVPETLALAVTEAFGSDLSILFGQTELNGVISQTGVEDSIEDQCGTLGRPLPCIEVCISDPETGEVTPVGEPGEIWVRGYQVMTGYFGLPEATSETVRADGWLRMGDLGTMDERGFLRIVGRLKDMIIRGGMNIFPREIEDVLLQHPQVSQISVVGVPDERWGEVIAAVIIPVDSADPIQPGELHHYCRERLAAHKAPEKWFLVEEYPLTPSGKIQKFAVVDQIMEGELVALPWERDRAGSV